MSGLTPLVDTLLATRLAQRLDLLPLKSELEIASPGAVIRVKKVNNELHLPSRSALQRQLGVGLLKSGATGHGRGSARAGEAVTLSVAARAVSAILNSQAGATAKITGTEPLWPVAQPVQAPLLAEKLASTVAHSGLFYESHLAQYVVGTRPMAQLAQEPQARLDATPSGAAGAVVSTAYDSAGDSAPATAASLVAEAIHPEALALVRQQLELLTLPLFRWAGEVWPGTAMDWEIQEEPSERQAADEPQARAWRAGLALRLPALGAVELRLTLAGSALQVQLGAGKPATVALLSGAGAALPPRFAALGLQLTDLKIGALAREPQAPP